jgi:transglutaminase-like putative cysteine protease
MQKSSPGWWDWTSVTLLFLLVETSASRLVSANWTSFLFLGQTAAYIGFVVGMALGYSRFSTRAARWISFFYLIVFLPLLLTLMIDQKAVLEEQFASVGGRLYVAYADFLSGQPVEDPIFFISLITLGFWVIGASAAFQLVRRQNYLAAVLPSALVLLVIQNYDAFVAGRVWFMAFFFLLALLLLGRLTYLENRQVWRERRIFLSPDAQVDLTSMMTVAAMLLIFISWTPPASLVGLNAAIRAWNRLTEPWRNLTERLDNALSALESPAGVSSEFYGTEIALGRGFPLSDTVMFRVQTPDLPQAQTPPRYYWRGYTYDYFTHNQWYTTGSSVADYAPDQALPLSLPPAASVSARFTIQTGDETVSLLYAPPQPLWFSRQGYVRVLPAGGKSEVISWYAVPALRGGEVYQVEAMLSNPTTQQLQDAGAYYPAWVTEKYLQLPANFSARITALAAEITARAETPYEKAVAITRYLRDNIEYVDTLPVPPAGRDPLEWMLFENHQAYCMYYASAEVLMLRSLGVPARLAVGFAQGEARINQETGAEYIVRKKDAHAWPEVYFPGIGWVEFEPTAAQPPLSRPLPPRQPDEPGVPLRNLPQLDDALNPRENLRGLQEETDVAVPQPAGEATRLAPHVYLLLALLAFSALTVYLSRRYPVTERAPALLRAVYERSGIPVPAWLINWERWTATPPTARAFESINFSLRLLESPLPVDATPIERAARLAALLPAAQNDIQTLLDEHQTSLYTSRTANIQRARRAARRLRWRALQERIRYLFEGKPLET